MSDRNAKRGMTSPNLTTGNKNKMARQGENTCELSELSKRYKCEGIQDIGRCFALFRQDADRDMDTFKQELKNIKSEVGDLRESVKWAQKDTEVLKDTSVKLAQEILSLELWGRKWNLTFRGLEGPLEEKPDKTEEVIRKFMSNDLGIPTHVAENMLFAAVHRLPSGPPNKKSIIVRFVRLADREKCLQGAYKLRKGSGIGVSIDLPRILAKERDRLLEMKRNLSNEEKKKAKLIYLKTAPFLKLKYGDKEKLAKINYLQVAGEDITPDN